MSLRAGRILFVSDFPLELHSPVGGIEASTAILVQALYEHHNVSSFVIAPDYQGDKYSEKKYPFGLVRRVPIKRFSHRIPEINRNILEVTNINDFDLIHFQGLSSYDSPASLPRILTVHGILEKTSLYEKNGIARFAHAILVTRKEVRARKVEKHVILVNPYQATFLGNLNSKRIWNVNNPVDELFFSQREVSKTNQVLFAGRISEVKDLGTLFHGFSKLLRTKPDLLLKLAGPGIDSVYGKQMLGLSRELDLDENIQFLGSLNRLELSTEMQKSKLLVLTSRQESAPMVIAEAFASGLPVVGTDVGGIPNMIVETGAGLTFEVGDHSGLADRIKSVLESSQSYEKNAIIAASAYHPLTIARSVLDCYETLLRL